MKLNQNPAALPRAGAIALLALVCSCNRNSQLEGHYSTANGLVDIEFKDAQKANLSTNLGGPTIEFDYERNGKEVKLKMPDDTAIATIGDDGCLTLTAIPQPLCKEKKVAGAGFFKRALSRGQRLEGKYTSPQGLFDLEFKDNNKVNQITLFGTTEIDYEVSGKEVKLKAPTGTMVGTIGDDGCLNFGGFYGAMCKTKIKASDAASASANLPSAAAAAQLAQEASLPASAVMPAGYLQEMPTAERVLADVSGPDSVETRARRYTAAKFLEHALAVLVHDHQFSMSPDERQLFQNYGKARNELNTGSAGVPGLTAKIDSLCCGRPAEVAYRRELLKRYFTPAWQTAFLRREAAVGEL
jgi:hypothetical protein